MLLVKTWWGERPREPVEALVSYGSVVEGKDVIAPLAKFVDWSVIQVLAALVPRASAERGSRLEEAIELLNRPNFIPAHSEPARVEFLRNGAGVDFRFATPRPCQFEGNNVVYGRLYRCGQRWQQQPAIVLLHGSGDFIGYKIRFPMLARQCIRAGFNVATLESPYHFKRRPRQRAALRTLDYLWLGEATAQAVAEIRALIGWLLREGCPAVALWGSSLGGRLAGLTIQHDARVSAAVLVKPGVRNNLSFPDLVFWPRIRAALREECVAWEKLNETAWSLTCHRPVIPVQSILLIEGTHDLLTPQEPLEELWRAWGKPEIWRLPHGHVSLSLVPGLSMRVLSWVASRMGATQVQQARKEMASGRREED